MEQELLKHLIVPHQPAAITIDATLLRILLEHVPYIQIPAEVNTKTTNRDGDTNPQTGQKFRLAPKDQVIAAPKESRQSRGAGNLICAFWYHHGKCSRDPGDLRADRWMRTCKHHHRLEPGTKVWKMPKKWHRRACGLELCPHTQEAAGEQDKNSQHMTRKSTFTNGGQSQPTAEAGREVTEGRMKVKAHKARVIQPVRGQVNRHENQKRVLQPVRGQVNRHENQKRVLQPVSRQAHEEDRRAQKRKRGVGESQETCFFWYHGGCKRDRECNLLRSLTEPPSFVQPPPDYMHYVQCHLSWCPGNQRFEHRAQVQDGKRRMAGGGLVRTKATRDVPDTKDEDEGKAAAEAEDEASEWFLDGFP